MEQAMRMIGMELRQGEAWPSFGECEGGIYKLYAFFSCRWPSVSLSLSYASSSAPFVQPAPKFFVSL